MLASKFSNTARVLRSDRPLDDDAIMRVAPSVFTEGAHDSRSDRYQHIATATVLDALRDNGFHPFFVCQQRTRAADKVFYTKHMLRLRHSQQIGAQEVNEIILLNSHDGSSSYQMIAGCFRFVCQNGLVLGDKTAEVRLRHKHGIVGEVIEGAYSVLDTFQQIDEHREVMKSIQAPKGAQLALASAALEYRYGEEHRPVTPEQLIQPRRWDDKDDSLWLTFNRVQENLIKGGLQGKSTKGGRRKTRAVTSIDKDLKLNKALWTLATQMEDYLTNR